MQSGASIHDLANKAKLSYKEKTAIISCWTRSTDFEDFEINGESHPIIREIVNSGEAYTNIYNIKEDLFQHANDIFRDDVTQTKVYMLLVESFTNFHKANFDVLMFKDLTIYYEIYLEYKVSLEAIIMYNTTMNAINNALSVFAENKRLLDRMIEDSETAEYITTNCAIQLQAGVDVIEKDNALIHTYPLVEPILMMHKKNRCIAMIDLIEDYHIVTFCITNLDELTVSHSELPDEVAFLTTVDLDTEYVASAFDGFMTKVHEYYADPGNYPKKEEA